MGEDTVDVGGARDGGSRGICLDAESYGKPQFRYDPACGRPFAGVCAIARARGRWFVDSLAREFPAATILGLWFNSLNARAGRCDDPAAILVTEGYGLFPAFFDGMLDAAPPSMTFVDGCEHAYRYDGDLDYLRSYHVTRRESGSASRLVSSENRAKYNEQVRAGFGFYLDAYIEPETSPWYIGPRRGTRRERLEANLSTAAEVADGYVWVYGEKYHWWPAGEKHWEEAMPGILAGSGDWEHAFGWAQVPDGVGFLVVLLAVHNQISDDDVCWFDNLGVYKL